MNKLAGHFMKSGVIYALAGFALGLVMAASKDFTLRSVHTHLNLIGWASMAIYALYYQMVPSAAARASAVVHLWLANAGLLVLTFSLVLLVSGVAAAEAGAAAGSMLSLGAMTLFVFIVFRTPSRGAVNNGN